MKNGRDYAAQADPSRNPNFGRNWSDDPLRLPGFKAIGEIAAEIVGRLPFQRKVERVHRLGPRILGEMLAELGAERSIMTIIDQKIDRFIKLNPETLQATGGGDFPPVPIHGVRQP